MITNFICLINVIPVLAGTIYIYYHQTLLYSLCGVALEYTVHQFYIADDIDEEQTARKKFLECIPICRNPELRKKAAVNLLTK